MLLIYKHKKLFTQNESHLIYIVQHNIHKKLFTGIRDI